VLLVGDTDELPTGRSSLIVADPDKADGDSDHIYEVIGTDRLASVYVGRLSVNTSEELQNQVKKILSYEKNPFPGSWPKAATLVANSENDDGSQFINSAFPSKYAAAVNAIAAFGEYINPPTFEVLHAGAANSTTVRATNQNVTDAINSGRNFVLYRGHGDGTSWASGWDANNAAWTAATEVTGLKNNIYPIVFSIACQNARIRETDSIAETWLNIPQGAVAHFGASVNSYTGENHERAKGIFKAIYQNEFTRLAPALAAAEELSRTAGGAGPAWDNNTFCYLLLGDPELTIRKLNIPRTAPVLISTNIREGVSVELHFPPNVETPSAIHAVASLKNGARTNGWVVPGEAFIVRGVTAADLAEVHLHADGLPTQQIFYPQETIYLSATRNGRGAIELQLDGPPGVYMLQRLSGIGGQWQDLQQLQKGIEPATGTLIPAEGAQFFRAVKLQ
jgi:hypothetical protein